MPIDNENVNGIWDICPKPTPLPSLKIILLLDAYDVGSACKSSSSADDKGGFWGRYTFGRIGGWTSMASTAFLLGHGMLLFSKKWKQKTV